MSRRLFALALAAAVAARAEEAAQKPGAAALRERYDRALAAQGSGDQAKAAALLYAWLADAPRTAEAYDSAQHLLASSLHELGLVHAALLYEAAVIKTRARRSGSCVTACRRSRRWRRSPATWYICRCPILRAL